MPVESVLAFRNMEKSEKADKGKLSCFVHISGYLGATLGPLGLRMHGIAPLNPDELGQYQSRVVGGILGPQFYIRATYLTVRQIEKNFVVFCVSLVV